MSDVSQETIQEIIRRVTALERGDRSKGSSPLAPASENTPNPLTADQNDYAPGNYDVLRLQSTVAVNITGISGGFQGRYLTLLNAGDNVITLALESASSLDINRIAYNAGAATYTLNPGRRVQLYYDYAKGRWRF